MVEQYDTESFDIYNETGLHGEGVNFGKIAYVPPVLTRSWFHTGADLGPGQVTRLFAAEYYRGPELLDDTPLPGGLSLDERREACRALRGSMLRQEVYALGDAPYQVTENTYAVRRVQPRVFLTYRAESIGHHYERDPGDPRVTHSLTLDVNDFGQVTRSAEVAYARAAGLPEQCTPAITRTETTYTNALADEPDDHRLPAPYRVRTFHLTGLDLLPGKTRFTAAQLTGAQVEKRLIKEERTRYRRDDLTGPCEWQVLESRALPYETYRLAFTPEILLRAYGDRQLDLDGAGYLDLDGDGNRWIPSGRLFYGPEATELDHARRHFFLPQRFRTAFHTAAVPAETAVAYDRHDLLVVGTTDPLANQVAAEPDYRTLTPRELTDANGNRSAVATDALGLVVATAVMGRAEPEPPEGDRIAGFDAVLTEAEIRAAFADPFERPGELIGAASTRLVYDLFAYQRTRSHVQPDPVGVYVLARETHGGDDPAVQHNFSYSDGFGREIQKKALAADGPPPQWVGSGWTEFNNKGKPVRQFEPFHSATHRCDFDARIGVAKTLFYDPIERVVAVLHPDHTYEKTVFSAWEQRTFDVNDTVATDPRTDPDLDGIVAGYFAGQDPDWLTWREQRQQPGTSEEEADAATKATAHADTPATTYLDVLGRTVLTRADNGPAGLFDSRVVLDIEGNQRALIDPAGRTVVEYDYDMLGNRTVSSTSDAGERRTLNDIAGNPARVWDSRGHTLDTVYDALRRPVTRLVQGFSAEHSDPATLAKPITYQRIEYGEAAPERNARGRVLRSYDGAGVVSYTYDFKGNVTVQERELAPGYSTLIDWAEPQPPGETFTARTRYDALNRPIEVTSPGSAVTEPVYDPAGRLRQVRVRTGGPDPAAGVDDIAYDAKGRRTSITYRNGVTTTYRYDADTFRLTAVRTPGLQDLHYTYDPAGNVTRIRDDAQQRVFFRNKLVDASSDYTYDPIYRLTRALGREHVGQAAGAGLPHTPFDAARIGLPHPADGDAMSRYCETYDYDAAGNLTAMTHRPSCPGAVTWSRTFTHDGNRLTSTTVGGSTENFGYDPHGNLLAMAHLPQMAWDFQDRLGRTQRQTTNGGGAEQTYYVYDAAGVRTRKVTVTAAGAVKEERIYLGGYEIYRTPAGLERETVHVLDGRQRIALIETRNEVDDGTPAEVVRYQFANQVGSVAIEVDEQARIISYEEYSPYGSTTFQSARTDIVVAAKRYRFTGRERDEESGLSYGGARYLAPWLGRWIGPDPAGTADGLNPFCYVRSNPVNLYDESGLYSRGGSTTSIEHFVAATRTWEPEALKHREVYASKAGVHYEPTGHAMIRIFDNDFREQKTADQIIPKMGEKDFSYYGHFLQKGKEKTQQKYVDAGLPLDIEHFFRVAGLAQDYPDWPVRRAYLHEEFKQTEDTRPAGRTSAFAPEDLFSNELGLIFGTTVGELADAPGFDFADELETYLGEIRKLFTENELKDGKYLTADRIADLRAIAKEYYGTEDLREFLKTSKIFNVKEIMKINDNAAVENYPFYNNPISAEEYKKKLNEAREERNRALNEAFQNYPY